MVDAKDDDLLPQTSPEIIVVSAEERDVEDTPPQDTDEGEPSTDATVKPAAGNKEGQ